MIGKLKWEDVYLLWNNESYNFRDRFKFCVNSKN